MITMAPSSMGPCVICETESHDLSLVRGFLDVGHGAISPVCRLCLTGVLATGVVRGSDRDVVPCSSYRDHQSHHRHLGFGVWVCDAETTLPELPEALGRMRDPLTLAPGLALDFDPDQEPAA